MAGKVRHLLNRSGRYHARIVVPKVLVGVIGKTELRMPLGGDYRQALRLLPGAVAQLQHEIALAERKVAAQRPGGRPARFPMAPDQIAWADYSRRLSGDDLARRNPAYAQIGIDDRLVGALRRGIAGSLTDDELHELVGDRIERYRHLGNTDAERGSPEWRTLAQALCIAEYEALSRSVERDEGDFTGAPSHPVMVNAKPADDPEKRVSLTKLWAEYVKNRTQAGFMRGGARRQAPVIKSLRKYLKHDNATRVTKKDLLGWRDFLLETLAAKTVSDVYLSTVRSLFAWAAEEDRIAENPAQSVKQPKPRKVQSRERGFTDDEALAILKASLTYEPKANQFGHVSETPKHTAAKRWAPILCAFTGARITEITQLRKEDVRQEGGRWVIRITPDSGTVKTGEYRDVPLHRQIIELGFPDYVKTAEPGPLFHSATYPGKYAAAAKIVSGRISQWLRSAEVVPEGVQPNHAWRHRFKTKGRDLGIDTRILDAIQGHAARTAGDDYGDVTVAAKARAIDLLPRTSALV